MWVCGAGAALGWGFTVIGAVVGIDGGGGDVIEVVGRTEHVKMNESVSHCAWAASDVG